MCANAKNKNKYTLLLLQSIPSKLKGITDYHAPIKKQFVKHTLLDVLEFSWHKHCKPNILFSQHHNNVELATMLLANIFFNQSERLTSL